MNKDIPCKLTTLIDFPHCYNYVLDRQEIHEQTVIDFAKLIRMLGLERALGLQKLARKRHDDNPEQFENDNYLYVRGAK